MSEKWARGGDTRSSDTVRPRLQRLQPVVAQERRAWALKKRLLQVLSQLSSSLWQVQEKQSFGRLRVRCGDHPTRLCSQKSTSSTRQLAEATRPLHPPDTGPGSKEQQLSATILVCIGVLVINWPSSCMGTTSSTGLHRCWLGRFPTLTSRRTSSTLWSHSSAALLPGRGRMQAKERHDQQGMPISIEHCVYINSVKVSVVHAVAGTCVLTVKLVSYLCHTCVILVSYVCPVVHRCTCPLHWAT